MPSKPQITWLFAALVLAASSQCVRSHAAEALYQHRQLESVELPLDNPPPTCDNESSCICKGATLAASFELLLPEPDLAPAAAVCMALVMPGLGTDSSSARTPTDPDGTTCYGSTLRSRLQRFLL